MERESFSVSEFIKIYRDMSYNRRGDNYFHGRNTKKLIEVYTNHNKIGLPYSASNRRWCPISKEGEGLLF